MEENKLPLFENFVKFVYTPHLHKLLSLEHNIVFVLAGNQSGKTANVAYEYFLRIIGKHPIADKNRLSKNIRCLSSSLPESSDADEQDNTQYLELKKLIPYEMILKDITSRSQTMVVSSPIHGKSYIEFKSTKQELQDIGKVQRCSVWADEEPPKSYWDESRVRLHSRIGDMRISLTPINGISWTFDQLYNRASYIWRTDSIVDALNEPKEEIHKDRSKNIAVIHMAVDDNPTLTKEGIELILEDYDIDDNDVYLLRRYGVFKQLTGKVHKGYNPRIHYIPFDKYFPDGIPYGWFHSRGIDYHDSRTPWSIGWLSASPDDEWFLWQEMHPSIDGPRAMNTAEIALAMARRSGDYYYGLNLIDPLANRKQSNTLFSVTDELNQHFDTIRKDHGIGTACYWEGWDTKDTKGENEIRKRLKNATKVGTPYSNTYREHGVTRHLPTFWICNTCPKSNHSMNRWSHDEYKATQTIAVNDPKPKKQQKFSHDNMVIECLAKDARLLFANNTIKSHTVNKKRRHRSATGR